MRKQNSFAIITIIFLLLLGYSIPAIVMVMEDKERKLELKSYEIEEISLSFQTVDFMEELRIFPDMLVSNLLVEQGETSIVVRMDNDAQGELEDAHEEVESKEERWIKNNIDTFLQVFHSGENIEFVDLQANYYVLMTSAEDEQVYPIWECYGLDKEKRGYRFWLDDMTGMVLGFDIPYEVIGMSDEEFYETWNRFGIYYGYDVCGLSESMTNVYKIDPWENKLMLFDEKGENVNNLSIYKIGSRMYFNVYPGSVSLYDGGYSEVE